MKTENVVRALSDYAQAINSSWTKTLEGILETARLCAEANAELEPKAKATLLGQLSFKHATFSKLAKIGKDNRLYEHDIREHLPPNYSTPYAVTKLDEKQLQGAVDSGALHPEAGRADIEALTGGVAADHSAQALLGYVRLPPEFPDGQMSGLTNALEELASEFGVEFIKRRSPKERAQLAYERAVSLCQVRRNKTLATFARSKIREFKAAKLRGSEKLAPKQRAIKWGFSENEVYIGSDYSPNKVREILEHVGLGNEFESLRKKAELVIDMPTQE